MKQATCKLISTSPYSQGKYIGVKKEPKETHADYEERTWRERLHARADGEVFIPGPAFKNCLSECAKYLSIQIPGKGKSTYTKHFEAGVMVLADVPIGIQKDEVPGVWRHVPSDGRRGGTKRVEKCFPEIPQWSGEVTFTIGDDTITQDVFEDVLRQAGMFIGIGVYRPRNNGTFGRFEVESIKWS